MVKKAAWVWLLAFGVTTAYFFGTYGNLPDRLATHFDAVGNPNGFQTKTGYLVFSLTFNFMINALLGLVSLLVSRIPVSRMNIPNKDYWLAQPERAAELRRRVTAILAFAAIFTNAAFLFAEQVVYQQNTPDPLWKIPINGGVFLLLAGSVALVIFSLLVLRPSEK